MMQFIFALLASTRPEQTQSYVVANEDAYGEVG